MISNLMTSNFLISNPATSNFLFAVKNFLILTILLFSSSLAFATLSTEEKDYSLEIGFGVGYAHVPDYIGSNEAQDLVLPFPYLRYRSEKFSVDRNAIQGNLWRAGNWSLELSFGGAIRVESDSNKARDGMEDLDFLGEAGPALHYYFSGHRNTDNALYLILPVRSAMSTDFSSVEFRGVTFNPTLRWRRTYFMKSQSLGFSESMGQVEVRPQISVVARSATEAYHDYYYGVDQEFVTARRGAYQAESGFGGYSINYSTALLWQRYLLAGGFSYTNISDAVFYDSPLVRQNTSLSFGLAMAWLF